MPRIADTPKVPDLSVWHTPRQLAAVFRRFGADPGDLFGDPSLAQLRECYPAALFAHSLGASCVRLLTPAEGKDGGRAPDAEIQIGADIVSFEITEVLNNGRRRADEYRDRSNAAGSVEHVPDEWLSEDSLLAEVRNRCRRKSAKRYGTGTGLLLYLNHYATLVDPPAGGALALATHEAATTKAFVYALTSDRIWHLWQGERVVCDERPIEFSFEAA